MKRPEAEGASPFDAAEDVEIFTASASADAVRAAWVLSASLASTAAELADLLNEIWSDLDDASGAVEEMLDWPFAVADSRGWRMDDHAATAFGLHFQRSDPGSYEAAHSLLLRAEEEREARLDPEDAWFVRGRIAYYLVGLDPERAADQFGRVFESEPSMNRLAARTWLTSLVLRKERFMENQARSVSFFKGFRSYVLVDRAGAREAFSEIVSEDIPDVWAAIAQHLLAVLTRDDAPSEASRLLESSIELSVTLGLPDNEIMARNTLVYLLAGAAHRQASSVEHLLSRAHKLARLNLSRADEVGDERLQASCRRAEAWTEWLLMTRDRSAVDGVDEQHARTLADTLIEAGEACIIWKDIELAGFAVNDAAQIYVDIGDGAAALAVIEKFLSRVGYGRLPESPRRRLVATVWSAELLGAGSFNDRAQALAGKLKPSKFSPGPR